ncbi:hypothetical protein SK128_023713 [Halocaridina rubra]|uniref:Glucosylceramidase n=1 Tax=Halocaridina rubra TaxID=373956 RepID=A0AAN9A082_HALRR
MLLYLLVLVASASVHAATECIPRQFEYDTIVCVCNATYCDEIGETPWPSTGEYTIITTSKDGLRFNVEYKTPDTVPDPEAVVVRVKHDFTYQTMKGFGGAFTDSTGINIVTLSNATQENLLRAYFSPEGIEYNLCRIPIAGSDFSVRPYSYDDVPEDSELINWALADEDLQYKIPMILRAQELSQNHIMLFGTPWAPPAWMKTSGLVNGTGQGELRKDMYQPYANYIVKFVEAYEAAGVPIWGLTPQNEPLGGFDENWAFNTCGFTAEDMRDWIKFNLGPTLEAAGMRRLALMVCDWNRDLLPWYIIPMMEDPDCEKYIDGTAVHWYEDFTTGPSVLDETQALFPNKFLLYSEGCEGWRPPTGPYLGDWTRAENYARDILENCNHFATGWVDWNMALDPIGGPNWVDNFVDSPIVVNATADEFYKQPTYYVMGHFSKFIQEGAIRVFSSVAGTETPLKSTAFHDPYGPTVIILHNRGDVPLNISVTDESVNYLNFQIPAKAIQTILSP